MTDAIKQAIEALEDACSWLEGWADYGSAEPAYLRVQASLASLRAIGDGADAQWHAEADRLYKCVTYATSNAEEFQFRAMLSAHLQKVAPPAALKEPT